MTSDESFLGRWSRRKQDAEQKKPPPVKTADEAADPAVAPGDDAAPKPSSPPMRRLEPAELQEKIASLPRIADIDAATDVTGFMQPWVPAELRTQALRKLWTVDPAVRDHVIFADYALDYNTPGAAPGYGPLSTTAEMAREALASFSRDPLAKPDGAEGSSADAGGAPGDQFETESDRENFDRAADQPIIDLDIDAQETLAIAADTPIAFEPDYVATREDADLSPSPLSRRRHGSAAPR